MPFLACKNMLMLLRPGTNLHKPEILYLPKFPSNLSCPFKPSEGFAYINLPRGRWDDPEERRAGLIIRTVLLQGTFRELKGNDAARNGLSGGTQPVAKPIQSKDWRTSTARYAQGLELFRRQTFTWETACKAVLRRWTCTSLEYVWFVLFFFPKLSVSRKPLVGEK